MEVIKVVQGGRKSFPLLMGEQMELAPWWLHLLHVKSRLPLFGPLNRVAARATVIAALANHKCWPSLLAHSTGLRGWKGRHTTVWLKNRCRADDANAIGVHAKRYGIAPLFDYAMCPKC
jgi:hypothetical protein